MKFQIKYFTLLVFVLLVFPVFGQVRIIILGSSTAAGTGVSHPDSAWVNRYQSHLQNQNANNEVINLAHGGYTTFHILQTGTTTPSDRPNPDVTKNITAALNENPDAIIINLPSNDAANGFPVSEQLSNYDAVLTKANEADVPVWIATPQGRNLSSNGRQNLKDMRDSTYARYGDKAIDFWTYIGQTNGTLNITYDSGDGVHLNDKGHKILFTRVVEKNISEAILTDVSNLEKEKIGLRIYPNPTKDMLFISFENEIRENTEVRLTDILGRQLGSYFIGKNETDFKINIEDLGIGAYQLIFLHGEKVWSEVFIKK